LFLIGYRVWLVCFFVFLLLSFAISVCLVNFVLLFGSLSSAVLDCVSLYPFYLLLDYCFPLLILVCFYFDYLLPSAVFGITFLVVGFPFFAIAVIGVACRLALRPGSCSVGGCGSPGG
jgi:hypothetical protein